MEENFGIWNVLIDFNKYYEDIKQFDEKLNKMKFSEYVKTQREVYGILTQL